MAPKKRKMGMSSSSRLNPLLSSSAGEVDDEDTSLSSGMQAGAGAAGTAPVDYYAAVGLFGAASGVASGGNIMNPFPGLVGAGQGAIFMNGGAGGMPMQGVNGGDEHGTATPANHFSGLQRDRSAVQGSFAPSIRKAKRSRVEDGCLPVPFAGPLRPLEALPMVHRVSLLLQYKALGCPEFTQRKCLSPSPPPPCGFCTLPISQHKDGCSASTPSFPVCEACCSCWVTDADAKQYYLAHFARDSGEMRAIEESVIARAGAATTTQQARFLGLDATPDNAQEEEVPELDNAGYGDWEEDAGGGAGDAGAGAGAGDSDARGGAGDAGAISGAGDSDAGGGVGDFGGGSVGGATDNGGAAEPLENTLSIYISLLQLTTGAEILAFEHRGIETARLYALPDHSSAGLDYSSIFFVRELVGSLDNPGRSPMTVFVCDCVDRKERKGSRERLAVAETSQHVSDRMPFQTVEEAASELAKSFPNTACIHCQCLQAFLAGNGVPSTTTPVVTPSGIQLCIMGKFRGVGSERIFPFTSDAVVGGVVKRRRNGALHCSLCFKYKQNCSHRVAARCIDPEQEEEDSDYDADAGKDDDDIATLLSQHPPQLRLPLVLERLPRSVLEAMKTNPNSGPFPHETISAEAKVCSYGACNSANSDDGLS